MAIYIYLSLLLLDQKSMKLDIIKDTRFGWSLGFTDYIFLFQELDLSVDLSAASAVAEEWNLGAF